MAAKAEAEEARKAEMMAGISAGYDKEAAAIRLVLKIRGVKRVNIGVNTFCAVKWV